ncbi:MAG: hypothetical protein JWP97_5829 [Labilithrix sp.]|nr:hypothetical protein [Labilithrix sp.]
MKQRLTMGVLFLLASACSGPSGDTTSATGLAASPPLPARAGAVIVDGCVLDSWQRSTLATPAARRVLQEVVLLCLVPRVDGTVGPRDPSAQGALARLLGDLRTLGYRATLGVAFTDETGQRYDGAQTEAFLADPAWRARFEETLATAAAPADGIDLDLQQLTNAARDSVSALVTEVSAAVRPAHRLDVLVPPSVTYPSDLPGGDAFDRHVLAGTVDRLRVMTLDYSERTPGPTLDPGWAVDAARLALVSTPNVDVALPLYGTDFGPRGVRPTTYLEAIGLAAVTHAAIERGPTTAPFFRYADEAGEAHELWFDDAESTATALGAWRHDVLPANVGVVYYGLGAEAPTLFEDLAARLP